MSSRDIILAFETAIFGFAPVRLLIRSIDSLVRRIFWVWGRVRFAATVKNRGKGCVCHWNSELKYPDNIILGDRVIIGANAVIGAHSNVRIFDDVRISRDVVIETAGLDFRNTKPPFRHVSKSILIEEGVWLGARSMVLGGVTIGKGSVVAAGAIVSKSIPAHSVVAGIPARIVKTLLDSE